MALLCLALFQTLATLVSLCCFLALQTMASNELNKKFWGINLEEYKRADKLSSILSLSIVAIPISLLAFMFITFS